MGQYYEVKHGCVHDGGCANAGAVRVKYRWFCWMHDPSPAGIAKRKAADTKKSKSMIALHKRKIGH